MKNTCTFIISLILSLNIYAQNTPAVNADVIYKLNGEEMKGKVTEVTPDELTFVYTGEALQYTIKKADVNKIVFASGRTETINPAAAADKTKDEVQMAATPADRHNKIAVLPFAYLLDKKPGADEIGYKAQDETFAFLGKYSAGYKFLDPRSTNAALIKAGVTKEKMRGYTMKELCDILGVEYVVEGTVLQDKSTQTSYSNGNASTTVKKEDDKVKANTYGSTFSNTSQQYEMTVSLAIYNDTNANIFTQTRKAFFPTTDGSFTAPLEFLLKRTPLYSKK
jgi:TolB-like protein